MADGYAFVCPHPHRQRWRCRCGDRRALMCLACCALDDPILDEVACGRCGESIEYKDEPHVDEQAERTPNQAAH